MFSSQLKPLVERGRKGEAGMESAGMEVRMKKVFADIMSHRLKVLWRVVCYHSLFLVRALLLCVCV